MITVVRKIKKGDRKVCLSLLRELYSHLSLEDLEEKFFWGKEQAYVLWADHKPVGVIVWEEYDYLPDNSCLLELSAIVIDKDNRLRGFGRDLYWASLSLVREKMDVCGIHVLATLDSVGFYERVMPVSQRAQTPALLIRGIWYVSLLCKI